MIADPHEIQRLRFTPGQDLLARDFRDGETFDALLRHWHNRAVHRAYGVSFGLRVATAAAVAKVDPGLAYDATGRELILPASRIVAFPVFTDPQLLVLRPGGELLWIDESRLQPCDSVPLARLINGFAGPFLDSGFRPPTARALARPRIGYGSTVAGGTAWRANLLNLSSLVSLWVQVDTRAAGFTRPPCYFAWLQGAIRLSFQTSASQPPAPQLPLLLFPSIEEEQLTGFRLRVLVPRPIDSTGGDDDRRAVLAAAQQSLSLCWLGIQLERETESSSEVHDGNS